MYQLLIVDDEPLARSGIKSMLDKTALDIEVLEMARNGQQAFEMIERLLPEIVITDIKMPVKDGLTLVRECNERFENPPVFIILTSYEDFNFARTAIRERAVDYLIKTEIDEKSLTKAVENAIEVLKKRKKITENRLPVEEESAPRIGAKDQIIKDIKCYLNENYMRPLSLSEVAAAFNFNPSYLSQMFSKYAGESVINYITALRIEKAQKLLLTGELGIAEISARVGFENQFYFSRVFKRVTGVPPKRFGRK